MDRSASAVRGARRVELALEWALVLLTVGALICVLFLRTGLPASWGAGSAQRMREAVVTRLAAEARLKNDSHPDPAVARVLVPLSEHLDGDFSVQTNAFGMREREYLLPKPAGLVRIVLLGDSFVYGARCAAEQRLGARLASFLEQRRAPGGPELEVLHLGVSSWSLTTECAWLRRQLDRLQPDLVLHVTHANDLNDVGGVRGFGALATFAPAHPERTDALIGTTLVGQLRASTGRLLPRMSAENRGLLAILGGAGLLPAGLGWESRTRLEEARASVLGLAAALARTPQQPPYLLVAHWGEFAGVLHAALEGRLEAEAQLYLPLEFWRDESTWVARNDNHWNPAGHEQVARVLYGTIRARGWLPALGLAAWPEAEQEAWAFARSGAAFASRPCAESERLRAALLSELEPARLDRGSALQIHGGIDAEGLVSPYASLLLGQPWPARALHVSGRALADGVLAGNRVRVWVEGEELGALVLEPGRALDFRAELPSALRGSGPLTVRFTSDDYVYRGDDLRHCVVFALERVALE